MIFLRFAKQFLVERARLLANEFEFKTLNGNQKQIKHQRRKIEHLGQILNSQRLNLVYVHVNNKIE